MPNIQCQQPNWVNCNHTFPMKQPGIRLGHGDTIQMCTGEWEKCLLLKHERGNHATKRGICGICGAAVEGGVGHYFKSRKQRRWWHWENINCICLKPTAPPLPIMHHLCHMLRAMRGHNLGNIWVYKLHNCCIQRAGVQALKERRERLLRDKKGGKRGQMRTLWEY